MSFLKLYFTAFLVSLVSFGVFVLFQAQGIYGGDSGDLVTAAYLAGVPHPPGYPLYTFLGWLVSHLPLSSVSWRLALLSSVPQALAVAVLFLLVHRITKKLSPAIFGALAATGNYLFFLYAVTPEVFALLDFFVIFLVYLLVIWAETGQVSYLYLVSFVFGLSLAHHQVILFLVPALLYYLYVNFRAQKLKLKSVVRGGLIGLVAGLSPYVYLPLVARGNSIINWDRPVDLAQLVRLVTRSDYGTFVSGGFYGTQVITRLLQIKAYGELLLTDMTWVGVVLALAGFCWLWVKQRKLFLFFILAFVFLGPVFLFYASFPLLNRFNVGTYERFLLPSYAILSVIVALGFGQALSVADSLLRPRLAIWRLIGRPALVAILGLYPLTMTGVTIWKFVGLPQDRTADNLGLDIVESLPPQSILLLARDTPLFTTQYVRYVLSVRPDVAVLHASLMAQEFYPQIIAGNFPWLSLPKTAAADFPLAFIKANRGRYPIFTNLLYPLDSGWFWVPYGLVYQLKSETQLPSIESYYEENRNLWQRFHDPTQGILSRFNHLMLSDVRDVYASARVEFGRTLLKAGKISEAETEFQAALSYGGDTQVSDTYTLLGLSELFGKHCDRALAFFAKAKEASLGPDKMLKFYEGVTYRDCAGDAKRAQELFREYDELRRREETPLR